MAVGAAPRRLAKMSQVYILVMRQNAEERAEAFCVKLCFAMEIRELYVYICITQIFFCLTDSIYRWWFGVVVTSWS